MPDSQDKHDEVNEVSPLNLAELKLRLLHGDLDQFAPHAEVIWEIIALGSAAFPLLPLVVELYRTSKLKGVAVSSLAELYICSRHQELLHALREKGALLGLSMFKQCELLEVGVSELEPELLRCLWQEWSTAGNLNRVPIVKALGEAGGPAALEMLEVIRYKMAGYVQEGKQKWAT